MSGLIGPKRVVTKFVHPKALSLGVTSLGVVFVSGMALAASHQVAPQPVRLFQAASDVTLSDPATDPSAPAGSTSTPDDATNAPSAPTSQQAAADTSDGAQTPADDPTPPADPVDPVVVVSATVSDWSVPVTLADGSVEQDKSCLWTYSDGATQQRLYENKMTFSGGVQLLPEPFFDCTLANAPAPGTN